MHGEVSTSFASASAMSDERTGLTRRRFLTHASVGAAIGSLAGGLAAMACVDGPRQTTEMPIAASDESVDDLIAHVRHVPTGEIALMIGTREVIHRDRSLAARLVDVARTAGR
jgi:hypothetical protein